MTKEKITISKVHDMDCYERIHQQRSRLGTTLYLGTSGEVPWSVVQKGSDDMAAIMRSTTGTLYMARNVHQD